LILFGIGLFSVDKDKILGALQISIGICNCLTATIYRLESPARYEIPVSELPVQSQMHIVFVVAAVMLIIIGFVRRIWYLHQRRLQQQTRLIFTMLLAFAVVIGPIMASKYPNKVGLYERLSIYSIQIWNASLSVESMYEIQQQNSLNTDIEKSTKTTITETPVEDLHGKLHMD
jgi:cytochrome bd-type quinol oxidase subunit 2